MTSVLVEEGLDKGAIWHLGDPYGEQKKLISGDAWVDLSHKSVISIGGVERLSWLHAITTQDFENIIENVWVSGLILDALGHINHQFIAVDDGELTWLVIESTKKGELLAFLEKMKFMLRVEVADRSSEFVLIRTPGKPDSIGGPFRLVKRNEIDLYKAAMKDYAQAGVWAYEAERVAAGRARILLETDRKSIPNELELLGNAVHMKKGCYPGQETVAKINNLGKSPRRLTLLHLDGSEVELPKSGEKVFDGETEVGFIGTVARHFELGPIGLAVIKRSVPLEKTLLVCGISATQELVKR